ELNGRWYTTIKFPIDIKGRPRCLAGYAIDITDRKLAEDAVAAEKERLAITLRSIGEGVITADIHGRIVIMNKAAEHLTGWKQEEAEGMPLFPTFRIVNKITRQPCESPVEKVLSTGDIVELDGHTILISQDGTERMVSYSGAPIMDRNNKAIGVVLVFRDMTEKQKLLDSLRRIDKLDSLGVLAGGIAHDFNNLLCGILGNLDLARSFCMGTPEALNHLDKALSVFNRARDLTQQLLTFSKGGTPVRKANQLSTLILDNAAFALSGSNVRCEYHFDQNLWLCDFDENQIGQVIDNIVINAQQAMPLGGQIEISARNIFLKEGTIPSLPGGRYVKVSIADVGIGIPGDLLGRIFDPFFTTKQKGNGLGLSICHSIMQKHDGFIGVDSVLGKGTTVHLYFSASGQETAKNEPACLPSHQGNGTILIMDDEDFIRDVMGKMLRIMGYTLVEAKDGSEALHFFAQARERQDQIRAAFFDLTIPGSMGGKEVIKEVRKIFPDLPVFASSGYSDDPAMARPSDFGFTDRIHKPYRITDLADLLNKHLQSMQN
ncbi:MAG TPA: ATP-binding protein, partial [Candidatus Ozemobacteraceae bacterium]|nr:ATP-binding protein [Candidatus Ozemobacteraceae bacterium]